MKKFNLNGDTANWAMLNVVALNNKSGIIENTTNIPENLYIKVTIADKFDTNLPNLEEVSEATSAYAVRHGRKRHFLLLCNGRVVGWAHFHRKATPHKVKVGIGLEFELEVLAKSDAEARRIAERLVRENVTENLEESEAKVHLEYIVNVDEGEEEESDYNEEW